MNSWPIRFFLQNDIIRRLEIRIATVLPATGYKVLLAELIMIETLEPDEMALIELPLLAFGIDHEGTTYPVSAPTIDAQHLIEAYRRGELAIVDPTGRIFAIDEEFASAEAFFDHVIEERQFRAEVSGCVPPIARKQKAAS